MKFYMKTGYFTYFKKIDLINLKFSLWMELPYNAREFFDEKSE